MDDTFNFPVTRLHSNITSKLRQIISAGVLDAVNNGLSNEIRLIDQDFHITEVARIDRNYLDGTSQVTLSSAFCQYLWLLCNISLQIADRGIIEQECLKCNKTIEQYLEEVEKAKSMPINDLAAVLGFSIEKAKSYIDYVSLTPELLRDDFWDYIYHLYSLADNLTDRSKELNLDYFKKISISTNYETRTNGAYCYGIAFVMLHELSHFTLSHLDREEQPGDEVAADQAAFWSIYSDVPETERFTANIAILCVFFALMMLNPSLEEDKVHPREDTRLFDYYDIIKNDNPKYTVFLVHLLNLWANINGIKGYPIGLPPTEDSVNTIRDFFQNFRIK